MSFRDVDSTAAATAYVEGLNQKWPARVDVMDKIADLINAQESASPNVLELCCGGGLLGTHLLTCVPNLTYTGIDQSLHLLNAARERLAQSPSWSATILQADLNSDDWYPNLHQNHEPIDAVVSMQSLHDLGGEGEVSRIYRLAYELMAPNGLFINADLIVEPGEELANNPGRLTISQHLELLAQIGFDAPECVLKTGGFGCIVGTKR